MTVSQPKPRKNQVFLGSFIHARKFGKIEYLHNTAICVDASGKIVAIEADYKQQNAIETLYAKLGWSLDDVVVTVARDGRQFFFPGFIDTHIHASQYPNVGLFGKTTLLDWLETYTFPMESSLSSLPKARKVYTRCIKQTLAHGTTTAAYYATIDVAATNLLADLCHAIGQRAFVGRVCMDRLGPDYYLDESPAEAVSKTRATIEHIRRIDPGFALVSPIITPRFAPACTSEMLAGLAALQAETQLPAQTHISENVDEIAMVKELFGNIDNVSSSGGKGKGNKNNDTYAGVYDSHGLLNSKMILAHAIHLSEGEADLIAARRAKVAHCPCSNSSLTSGVARVRWLLEKGIQVGLGSDVSGGYSPSILVAARQAKLVSNHLAMPDGPLRDLPREERDRAKLSVDEVLYLATKGGAEVLGLADVIGSFEVGMQWDAQLIDLGHSVPDEEEAQAEAEGEGEDGNKDSAEQHANVDIFGWETWEERLAKWVFNGDDRNTKKVWVQGRLVHGFH